MNEGQEGWTKRQVSYEQIHKVKPEQFQKLIDSLEVADGQLIGDFMAGYGSVTRELYNHINKHKIRNVGIVMVERFREQLSRTDPKLEGLVNGTVIIRKQADVRSITYNSSQFDSIVIKMGLHEIPKEDQQQVINQAYRLLKPNGILALWDVCLETEDEQSGFRTTIRKKDELAGLETLAEQRYFYRRPELAAHLTSAGFKDVEPIHTWDYHLDTEERAAAELCGDRQKLKQWNNHLRTALSEQAKIAAHFEDCGDTIFMTWKKGILRARKD